VRYAEEHGASLLEELTPVLLDDFLASRSRPRPRGFNHLLGVVRRLLEWAVAHELLEASPLQTRPRRETATRIPFLFDITQARRLLDAAAALPDYRQAPQRGATYRTIFALCYGLGLRVGEASALRVGDVDAPAACSSSSAASSARVDSFRTARGSANSSPSSSSADVTACRCTTTHRCSPSTGTDPCIRAASA
jgi:site-specific recombinase XerD